MTMNRVLRTVLMVTLSLALAVGMWGVMPAGIAEAAGIDFPLLEENFNYGTTAGNLTAVTTNWTVHSGTGIPPQYVTSNLSMAGYGSSGFGGAVTIDNANTPDVNRAFSTSTISDILYYAALVNISTATTTGDYFLHMKDNGTYFRGRLFAKDESGVLRFGIAASGTAVYSTDSFSYNTTYLVVVKYDPSTDDASLYVLTSYSATEPASPTAFSDGTFTTGNAQLAIALRQSTNIPDATIDGIRVAKDWNTVVGQDTVTLSSLTAGNTYYFGDTLVAMALTSGDPGTVSVTKHSVPPGGDPASTGEMPLQWNITATGSGFALDLMLCYNDEELGGLTEANLLAYRWDGTSWGTGMGTVNTVNNCVTVTGITGFSKWALGTSQPTAVTFSGLSAASPFAALAVGLLAAAGLVVLRKRK
ncbi:MAG TPA: hypothetical protein PKZ84_21205 [Anaerolineae bacterium]|nr:hypothetical protein [Anaerolineae bacterium]HQI87096.1 hypothetical protein [Anaerolineae bacterium]